MSEYIDNLTSQKKENLELKLPDVSMEPDVLSKKLENEDYSDKPKTLSSVPFIANIQGEIYNTCGIEANTISNSGGKKLLKGFIDGCVINKMEVVQSLANLSKEQIKKVAEYILKNIDTIIKGMISSIPNGIRALLGKDLYDGGVFLASLLPTDRVLSLAMAPLGLAAKEVTKLHHFTVNPLSALKGEARERYLKGFMEKPLTNARQILSDARNLVINPNGSDFEEKLYRFALQNTRDLDIFIKEGVDRIHGLSGAKQAEAIKEFEPWKKLAIGLKNEKAKSTSNDDLTHIVQGRTIASTKELH